MKKRLYKIACVRIAEKDIKIWEDFVKFYHNVKFKQKLVVNCSIGLTMSALFVRINS